MKFNFKNYEVEIEDSEGKSIRQLRKMVSDAINEIENVNDTSLWNGKWAPEEVPEDYVKNLDTPTLVRLALWMQKYKDENKDNKEVKDAIIENEIIVNRNEYLSKKAELIPLGYKVGWVGEGKVQFVKYKDENKEIKDEWVKGPRGEFKVSEKSKKELENEGYGYHHSFESNGNTYYVMVKNNSAVACKDSKVKDAEKYNLGSDKRLQPGSTEYRKLEEIAKKLTEISPNKNKYIVRESYQDYGAGMIWTTIINTTKQYQILSPRDWLEIINKDMSVDDAIAMLQSGKYWLDKDKSAKDSKVKDKDNEYINKKLSQANADEGKEIAMVFENNDGEMYNRVMDYLVKQYAKRVVKDDFDETQFKQLILNVVSNDAKRLLKEVDELELWNNIGNRYYLAEWLLDSIIDRYEWEQNNK